MSVIGTAVALLGSSLLGGVFNSGMNHVERRTDRAYNSAEAQKNRDWQTEMSNTAYQRQVADMKSAGLNPILAASGGTGASTPTSTPASVNSSPSDTLSSAVKIGSLIASVALKNPKVAQIGFGADVNSASKRKRYS